MSIPKPKVFWPLTIDGSNCKIDIDNGSGGSVVVASIAQAVYLSAETLRAAVQTALAGAGYGGTWTVTVDTLTGYMTFANSGFDFRFRFSTGANVANCAKAIIGFFNVDYNSVAKSLTSIYQHANGWYSPTAVKSDTKTQIEEPNSVVSTTMGGQVKSISEIALKSRTVDFHFLPPEKVRIDDEDLAHPLTAMERWWTTGRGKFRYWPDGATEGTSADYFLDSDVLTNGLMPERQFTGKEVYHVGPWRMRNYVP